MFESFPFHTAKRKTQTARSCAPGIYRLLVLFHCTEHFFCFLYKSLQVVYIYLCICRGIEKISQHFYSIYTNPTHFSFILEKMHCSFGAAKQAVRAGGKCFLSGAGRLLYLYRIFESNRFCKGALSAGSITLFCFPSSQGTSVLQRDTCLPNAHCIGHSRALFLLWRRTPLGTVRQNQGLICANCENLRKCIDKGQRDLYI